MSRKASRSFSIGRAALAAGLLAGCATAPFTRPPPPLTPLSIVNEATGKHYDDCHAAFTEATSDTVLTFSAGVFHCGAEVESSADWIVIRGAGMGETFLDATPPGAKKPGDLTALRVKHAVRVEDLTFGGLTAVEGEDARATLVRVGIATDRPAIVGGPNARVDGGVLIIHSVISGWLNESDPGQQPKPLAINGNDRVAALESVFIDVEQEFERFPSPGSVVLLSSGVERAFAIHEPAARLRRDASRRPNVPCANAKNPTVFCLGEDEQPPEHEGLLHAAKRLAKGAHLAEVEGIFRSRAAGFAERFHKTLGGGLRQPDVYWFDDSYAKTLEAAAIASRQDAIGLLAQSRLASIVDRCRNSSDKGIRTILDAAIALDGLLKNSSAEDQCRAQLKAQTDALVAECRTAWDWDRVLTKISNADTALDMKGEIISACRKEMASRLPPLKVRGPLVYGYVRSVGQKLQIDDDGADTGSQGLSLVGVVAQLPAVTTRSDRPSFNTPKSDILDRMIAMAQVPGAGDGRKLVEITPQCKPSGGTAAAKASTVITLGELPPRARASDSPRTVLEFPVEATRDDIPEFTAEGGINMALVKRCDEKAALAYRSAVRRYVIQELSRLSQEGPPDGQLEAEAGLQLIKADHAEEVELRMHRLPLVVAVLSSISDALRREPLEAVPVARGTRTLTVASTDSAELPPPPQWRAEDFARAADVLAGAHVISAVACKSLLPDVPWQVDGTGLSGAVVLESAALQVHCEPGERDFTLTLVTPKGRMPAKLLAAIQKVLVAKMGPARPGKRPEGQAVLWAPAEGKRSGFVLTRPAKPGHPFGSVIVPIGSVWLHGS